MRALLIFASACICLSVGSRQAYAQDWEFTGYAGVEYRQYIHGSIHPGQHSGRNSASIILEPEAYRTDGDDTFTVRPYFRYDARDSHRTHSDIRQLDWVRAKDDWEIRAGVGQVFWGVAESRHLVDIINQTDLVDDIDEEAKLGQPMLQLATFQSWGDVRFFYLPYFRERTFPGQNGRLRSALPVDTDRPHYTSSMEEWHPDMALRYQHVLGDWDIGLAHFYGTGREPSLQSIVPGTLTPVYEIINQSSLDLQYTTGSWLWKLEAIGREGQGKYFGAAVGGFEYTFANISDSKIDLGLLTEFHYDGRDVSAPPTVFDNDLFLGTRLAFNDTQNTEFLGGVLIDAEDGTQSYLIEASRRLTDNLKLDLDAHIFSHVDTAQPIYFLRDDDNVQLQLNYFF